MYVTFMRTLLAARGRGPEPQSEDEFMDGLSVLPDMMKHWTFCTTKRGYYALVPRNSTIGDRITVLYGPNVPVIIRTAESGDTSSYRLVGPTYVHGIMDGEVLDMMLEAGIKPERLQII
jgi:hypothetical protein